MVLGTFMDWYLNVLKPTNIILYMQVSILLLPFSAKRFRVNG